MMKNTISSRNTAIIKAKTLVFSAYSGNWSCFSSNSLIMRRLRAFSCHFRAIFFAFHACSPGFAQNLSQNRIKAYRRCFSAVFLFPLIQFHLYSLFVCVSLWLSVYEEGREEYLWEIRQRGGGAAPSRPCCGATPYIKREPSMTPFSLSEQISNITIYCVCYSCKVDDGRVSVECSR